MESKRLDSIVDTNDRESRINQRRTRIEQKNLRKDDKIKKKKMQTQDAKKLNRGAILSWSSCLANCTYFFHVED